MTKHTPTPWQVIPKYDHGNMNHKIANESYTWIIAEMKADNDINTQENNANHIVKCVNMHDELITALNQAIYSIEYWQDKKSVTDENFINNLKTILSKAKGE